MKREGKTLPGFNVDSVEDRHKVKKGFSWELHRRQPFSISTKHNMAAGPQDLLEISSRCRHSYVIVMS